MLRRDENSTNIGALFSDIANIAILLVMLVAITATVVGLWRSQRGFFLSGLGALVFIVLLSYADASRSRWPQASQEGIRPFGLAKRSVREILAFMLIAGFGQYIYYARLPGEASREKDLLRNFGRYAQVGSETERFSVWKWLSLG